VKVLRVEISLMGEGRLLTMADSPVAIAPSLVLSGRANVNKGKPEVRVGKAAGPDGWYPS